MKTQRQISNHIGHGFKRIHRAEHLARLIRLVENRAGIEQAIAQTRGVSQQVTDGDRSGGWVGIVDGTRVTAQNAAIGKLGDEALDRIVEREMAGLEKQQDRHRGHQLGVRKGSENMVAAQRNPALPVSPTHLIHVNQIAPRQHRPGHTGQHIEIDIALH